MRHTLGLAITLCAAVAFPRAARAQSALTSPAEASEARSRFQRGVALLELRDYSGALAEFEASYAISGRPAALFNVAVALEGLHRYPEAEAALVRYLATAPVPPARHAEVQRGLETVRDFIAHVTLEGLPDGASVTIDGAPAPSGPVAVATGTHLIVAHAPGYAELRQSFSIAGRQSRALVLEMAPELPGPTPPAPARPARVVIREPPAALPIRDPLPGPDAPRGIGPVPFAVSLGVTVALGVAALVMGANTLSTRAELDALPVGDPRADEIAARGLGQRTATNVLFGAAAAVGIVTVVLVSETRFNAPRVRADVSASPRSDGGAQALLRVRF